MSKRRTSKGNRPRRNSDLEQDGRQTGSPPPAATSLWRRPTFWTVIASVAAALSLGNDVYNYWFRKPQPIEIAKPIELAPGPPRHFELFIQTLGSAKSTPIPELKREGIPVELLLLNRSVPDAELHNVVGQVWTDTEFLIATRKEYGVVYRERVRGNRVEFDLNFPVFSKASFSWLPTWIYSLPPPGKEILLGAQLVSAETDFKQFRWRIVNEGGMPRLTGGDATPRPGPIFRYPESP